MVRWVRPDPYDHSDSDVPGCRLRFGSFWKPDAWFGDWKLQHSFYQVRQTFTLIVVQYITRDRDMSNAVCVFDTQAAGVVHGVLHSILAALEVLPVPADPNTWAEIRASGPEESGNSQTTDAAHAETRFRYMLVLNYIAYNRPRYTCIFLGIKKVCNTWASLYC